MGINLHDKQEATRTKTKEKNRNEKREKRDIPSHNIQFTDK